MACVKVGSKTDVFQRRGQAWFCTTGLPSDITIDVAQMSFHLHKFPLISRMGKLAKMVEEVSNDDEEGCEIRLPDMPGGPDAFELSAKFCYGVKVELTPANVAGLRCAAEYLEMTESYGEDNLAMQAESFLTQVAFRNWKDSVATLRACEPLLPLAEDLRIVKRCVDSIAAKACTDPSLFGWPIAPEHGNAPLPPPQSPGGSVLWNGISTGVRPRLPCAPDWWQDDVAALSLPLFERVISTMERKGLRSESIAGAINLYALKHFPGLNHRRGGGKKESITTTNTFSSSMPPLEADQRALLETLENLLPSQKGSSSTHFLYGLLRTAMILHASSACKDSLEKRIGEQLEQANPEDLLIPNYSYTSDTLYEVDCIQRILDHFLAYTQTHESDSPESFNAENLGESPTLTPMMAVAKLIDEYLAEIASDANLKLAKFQALAEALPDYARVMDDGLYRAIDTYLKAHPWLTEEERGRLSCIMDCQKLSLEACTHAAQNERLPLRVVVQVLFFEQLQLRAAVSGSFMGADISDPSLLPYSRPILTEGVGGVGVVGINTNNNTLRENHVLKMDMETIRSRVAELEDECSTMRHDIKRIQKPTTATVAALSSSWNRMAKKLGCKLRFDVCDCHEKPNPTPPPPPMIVGGSGGSRSSAATSADHAPRKLKHRRSSSSLT